MENPYIVVEQEYAGAQSFESALGYWWDRGYRVLSISSVLTIPSNRLVVVLEKREEA